MDHQPKGAGLSAVFAGACLVALLASIGWQVYQARAAASTNQAVLCSYRAYINDQLRSNLEYLRMTPAERAAKYGDAFAHINPVLIRQGIAKERAALASFSQLDCS